MRWILVSLGIVGMALVIIVTANYGPALSSDSITYLATGKNLASGQGFHDFDGSVYHQWPPLLPILIALFHLLGLSPVETIRILYAITFGSMAYLTGHLLSRRLGNKWLAPVGASAVVLSPALFRSAIYLLSDWPLAFLAALFLFMATDNDPARSMRWGLLWGIIAAAAFLTRYAGIAVVITGLIWLMTTAGGSFWKRLWRSAVFGIVAVLPVAVWIIRNTQLVGSAAGQRAISQNDLPTNIAAAFGAVADGFLPPSINQDLRVATFWAAMIILALAYLYAVRHDRRWALPPVVRLGVMFVLVYTGTVIVAATATAIDPPDTRLMAPIYVPLILTLLFMLDSVIGLLSQFMRPRHLAGLLILIFVPMIAISAITAVPRAEAIYRDGTGQFSGRAWRESQLLEYIRTELPAGAVASNAPEPIYYYAAIGAHFCPQKHLYNSPAYRADNLADFKSSCRQSDCGYLVWFDAIARPHLYSLDELKREFRLDELVRFPEGTIYQMHLMH